MGSQPFDQSSDPILGFASEVPSTLIQDPEPAFLRPPTAGQAPSSFTSLGYEPPAQRARVGTVATVAVAIGVLAGFAGGYAFAHRTAVPQTAATPLRLPSANPEPPRAERPTEAARDPNIGAPALPPAADAASAPSTVSSATRRSTTERPASTVVPITGPGGAIEVLSNPRGAEVVLDGSMIGRAPLSIADIDEGTHEVRIELAGFNPWVTSVRVKNGSRVRVRASLEQ